MTDVMLSETVVVVAPWQKRYAAWQEAVGAVEWFERLYGTPTTGHMGRSRARLLLWADAAYQDLCD